MSQPQPWYRQFWPWFLIVLPGSVVVASIVTIGIAIKHDDSVVRDNYYREGLAINRELAAIDEARNQHLSARIHWHENRLEVELNQPVTAPQLTLNLIHQLHSKLDRQVILHPLSDQLYSAELAPPQRGIWSLELRGGETPWRLRGRFKPAVSLSAGLAP